jgi:hypothetical protein
MSSPRPILFARCAECHDQLEAAWKYGLEHRDEIVVLDEDGDRVT